MTNTQAPNPPVVPVILAGGNGSRLWPLSRQLFPKQFLTLGHEHSMLQRTVLRCQELDAAHPPLVVAAEPHRFLVQEHLADVGYAETDILLEPMAKNTAPAIAAACAWVKDKYGPDAIMLVMPADHMMGGVDAFVQAVTYGVEHAMEGRLVTFGVLPERPETGYGYIKVGRQLDAIGVSEVDKFVEKPDLETAKQYHAAGDYLWNAGIFLFRVDTMEHALSHYEPEILTHASNAVALAKRDGRFLRLAAEPFMACKSESIDYAVMERSDRVASLQLLPSVQWDDVGSWAYLDRLDETDEHGNKHVGDVMFTGSQRNLVFADHRLVTLVGVDDIVVVETGDAVLVTRREHAQDVKQLTNEMAKKERAEVKHHPRVYRPWGFYETISHGPRFQSKRIMVSPGQKLSLQMHHHRAEHWIVVKGTAVVTIGGVESLLSENQSTYIPLGETHRLENPGKVPLELIEVQSGAYLGEDDIVRLDDIYGREPKPDAPSEQAA